LNSFKMSSGKWENNEEIKIFREYLRIPSVHPDIDYSKDFNKLDIPRSRRTFIPQLLA